MDRIAKLFSEKKNNILSVYFTAGFPTKDSTAEVIRSLTAAGVDMIEIGVPFSDPMADGPVIQHSSQCALNNGMTQTLLFEQLKDIRKVTDIPLIMMGYLNTAMQFGFENYCRKAAEVGVDGFIIPDIPLEEYESHYKPIAERYGLKFVLLVTPETDEERVRRIDDISTGFVYLVSSASTTGPTGPVTTTALGAPVPTTAVMAWFISSDVSTSSSGSSVSSSTSLMNSITVGAAAGGGATTSCC